jgi:hypothetical protein
MLFDRSIHASPFVCSRCNVPGSQYNDKHGEPIKDEWGRTRYYCVKCWKDSGLTDEIEKARIEWEKNKDNPEWIAEQKKRASSTRLKAPSMPLLTEDYKPEIKKKGFWDEFFS